MIGKMGHALKQIAPFQGFGEKLPRTQGYCPALMIAPFSGLLL
jgi:hypothetical protein